MWERLLRTNLLTNQNQLQWYQASQGEEGDSIDQDDIATIKDFTNNITNKEDLQLVAFSHTFYKILRVLFDLSLMDTNAKRLPLMGTNT